MKLVLILLLAFSPQVFAIPPDKQKHLTAGALIGFTVTLGTKKPKYGFMAGCAAGALKEGYDSQGHGTVELTDFAYTCAGAGLSSWIIKEMILLKPATAYR